MRQFLLFIWNKYYPGGGWNDFDSSYDDVEDAIGVGTRKTEKSASIQGFHVVDRVSGEILFEELK